MKTDLITRILAGANAPLGLLLAILFFLPWVEIQCGNLPIGEMSGYQLATGQVSVSEGMEPQEPDPAEPAPEEPDDVVDARPFYWLGLLTPAAIVAFGVLAVVKRMGLAAPIAVAVCAVVGLAVVIVAANVDFTKELMESAEEKSAEADPNTSHLVEPQAMAAMVAAQINVGGLPALWFSLVGYVAALLLGGGGVTTALMARAKRPPSQHPHRTPEPVNKGPGQPAAEPPEDPAQKAP